MATPDKKMKKGETPWRKHPVWPCWLAQAMRSAPPWPGALRGRLQGLHCTSRCGEIAGIGRRTEQGRRRRSRLQRRCAKEEDVQKLFADVERTVGPIEVCLFNAGSNVNKPLLDTTEKLFFKAWELACYAGFLVGREAARCMLPRERGTILFTGATASVRGGKGFAAFSSAKFGLRAVAQAMARELGPKNIHVVHLLIDAGVDSEEIRRRYKANRGLDAADIPEDSLTKTSSIAEAYWFAHQQSKDGWTHEFDLRPGVEKW